MEQTEQMPRVGASFRKSETGPRKAGKNNIAALDGVRAIAALLVVSVHVSDVVGVPWNANANPLASAIAFMGRTGVILFFVLSGFLLFLPYARALLFQEEWPSARKFYLRRIFRIWPGYYVTLAAMVLLFARNYLEPSHWSQLGLFLTFFMDSSPKTFQQIDGPFWTLAIEWQFYILLPWIALCFSWIVKRFSSSPQQRLKALLGCCMGLILCGLLIRGFGVDYQRHPNINLLIPPPVVNFILFFIFGVQGKYLEVFSCGMIVSVLYTLAQHPEFGSILKARLQRLSNWAWRFGWLVLIWIALWQAQAETDRDGMLNFTTLNFLRPLQSFYAWLGEPVAGVGYALCVVAILFGSPGLRWLFETRFLRWIGMLSYGLYMWHLNLLIYFYKLFLPYLPHVQSIALGKGMEDVLLWAILWIIIIPFCYIFYKVVEEPGMRLGARLTARKFEPLQFASIKALLSPRTLLARMHRS